MSVINQMLRDLDERQASEQERAGLPPRLRPLPPNAKRTQPWRMLLLGMGIGALAAGGAVALLMAPDAPPPAPPVAAVPPAPTLAAASEPVSNDLAEMKLSTLLAIAQSMAEQPAATDTANSPAPAPVETDPAAKPAQKPAAPPPKAATPVNPQPQPAPAASKPPPPAQPARPDEPATKNTADARIDKQPRGDQARPMAETEYRKAMQAVRRGDSASAQPLLQRAIGLDPALAPARQALLSVLVGARQWPEAQQVARDGLALDPAQTGWAVILARLQFEQGDAAGAVTTLENHAVHAAADADYQGLFAYLLQKQQRPAEAAQRFKAALTLRPGEGRWWFGLATALEGVDKGDEAREAYARAREAGNLPADMAAIAAQKLK
jgi:MSHA biogenesis protein MshN